MCVKDQKYKEQNILLKLSFPIIILMCCLIFLAYKDYQRQKVRLHIAEEILIKAEKILENTEKILEQQK